MAVDTQTIDLSAFAIYQIAFLRQYMHHTDELKICQNSIKVLPRIQTMHSPRSQQSPKNNEQTSAADKNGVRILRWVLAQGLEQGAPLTAQSLGDALGLSRFPIQQALAKLTESGFADRPNGRGFVLAATNRNIKKYVADATKQEGTTPYLRIARDRLAGRLPKELTEVELASRYGLTRMQLAPVLNRMAQEGWIRRKTGNGWSFTELIDSVQAHEDAYVFRMAVEPAALLAPGFSPDLAALGRLKKEQTALRDGRLGRITSEELFELGARFHETLVGFSNNEFFVEAIRRVNQRRRLVEYEAMAKPSGFMKQCEEHLALIDLIEQGKQRDAATFLHRHLDIVRSVKINAYHLGNQADEVIVHF